jgi:hypothetical protein
VIVLTLHHKPRHLDTLPAAQGTIAISSIHFIQFFHFTLRTVSTIAFTPTPGGTDLIIMAKGGRNWKNKPSRGGLRSSAGEGRPSVQSNNVYRGLADAGQHGECVC